MNNNYFEHLFETTGDLLYRVRIYDRELTKVDEIIEMDETYSMIERKLKNMDNDAWKDRAAHKLLQMKHRLVTMMEDLLFSA